MQFDSAVAQHEATVAQERAQAAAVTSAEAQLKVAEAQLKNAKAEYASEAEEIATYTAIISVAGVTEATIQATNFSSSYFNFTGFVVAGVLFIFLTIPLARFTDHLIRERELRERALAG